MTSAAKYRNDRVGKYLRYEEAKRNLVQSELWWQSSQWQRDVLMRGLAERYGV